MATWSGLWEGNADGNEANGEVYAQINGDPPGIKRLNLQMQKRGNYGIAKANGGVVPATRLRGDYITVSANPGPAKNSMLIPGTATDGRNPPSRDIEILNAHGDVRPSVAAPTASQVSAGTHGFGNDTRLNWSYATDLSGNGAPGFTPGDPNAPPYT